MNKQTFSKIKIFKILCSIHALHAMCVFGSTYGSVISKLETGICNRFSLFQNFPNSTYTIILQDNCHVSFIEYIYNMLNAYIGPNFRPLFKTKLIWTFEPNKIVDNGFIAIFAIVMQNELAIWLSNFHLNSNISMEMETLVQCLMYTWDRPYAILHAVFSLSLSFHSYTIHIHFPFILIILLQKSWTIRKRY